MEVPKSAEFRELGDPHRPQELSPRHCKKLWEAFRKKLNANARHTEQHKICKREVQENFWNEAMIAFPERMDVYMQNETSDIKGQEELTKKMLGAYTNMLHKKDAAASFEMLTDLVESCDNTSEVPLAN